MKPPVRQRVKSTRLLGVKRTETKRSVSNSWYKKEQQSLIQGLSQQLRSNAVPDLLELQKRVPKRSLLEIQNLLKSLKASLARRVHHCVRKQIHEEQKSKVPIELWDELAHKMAAVHEETISTAFSQMLVIAATEPLSQLHSVPSLQIDLPSKVENKLNSTRGMANGTSSPSSKKASSLVQPSSISSTKKKSNGTEASSAESQVSEKVSTPTVPKTNLCQTSVNQSETVSKIPPPATTPRATTVSIPPNSKRQAKHRAHGQSKQAHQQRSVERDSTVDFGKIYKFMSNINTNKGRSTLTAMESAVLLDLLMSLPEELPLLDCKELQHHLLQVHSSLTSEASVSDQRPSAANPARAEGTDISPQMQHLHTAAGQNLQTEADTSAGTEQRNAGEMADDISGQPCPVNPPNDRDNWATSGLFPLNPFMFPISLLKRQ
ncbi:snRNA-activating protein complex subunit 2 [Astyanax mexicanus]|uniref:snRNA-activating protein complex subunit 2 n=1 Tax=Astyanax mexicanus TaxID=7994 RepID=UPI0020CB23F7|nr:snRNA-activating protein complex subunit 2 [Astyanax mexicanus]